MENAKLKEEFSGEYKYGFHETDESVFKSPKGLNAEIVANISRMKKEPAWMLERRLEGLKLFREKPMPTWGADLSAIDFDNLHYYSKPSDKQFESWDDVPEKMKNTFDRLGIPQAEQKFLAGVGAQYDSEMVYHHLKESLEEQGVVFLDMDSGLREHEELVKKYFGTVIPTGDNKFAALNTAVWSGGSFVHIPAGVKVDIPLQAYFRINAKNVGQFERTLIVAEPGSFVHYVEGCFTKGTPIVTENGPAPIEEVIVGNKVLTHKGRFKRVTRIQKRSYSGKLFSIKCWGDSSQKATATAEHPFLAVKRQRAEYTNTEWNPEWTSAAQLSVGDYLAIPIDKTRQSREFRAFGVKAYDYATKRFYREKVVLKTDSDFFRLIGYYLAEGTTISGHYLSFTFNVKERGYIDDVKALLTRYFGKKPLEYAEYNHGVSLILCSTRAARLFADLFGNHALEKRVPRWVEIESPDKQAELIKGFWRGDGSFMCQRFGSGLKNNFRLNTTSAVLARQLRGIILRAGIFAGIWKRTGNRHNAYALHVGGSYLAQFAALVGKLETNQLANGQVALQKTMSRVSYAKIAGGYAFVPIRTISEEFVENTPVYNFSVEDDESYVAGGVAVHNCSAPIYSTDALHSAVVEILALQGSHVRYTTIQNWSSDVYNLVTKRAKAFRDSSVEWIDGNIGSRVTQKYPCVMLMEPGARGEVVSIAFAGKGQRQDAGAKIFHLASDTSSNIISKSVSKDGGRTVYRGLVSVAPNASRVKSNVECDALILDEQSASDTIPYMSISNEDVSISHEASVSKLDDQKLFYLRTRGFTEEAAKQLLVQGFIEPFTRQLPMEYAVELNRLIELEMEGSVG